MTSFRGQASCAKWHHPGLSLQHWRATQLKSKQIRRTNLSHYKHWSRCTLWQVEAVRFSPPPPGMSFLLSFLSFLQNDLPCQPSCHVGYHSNTEVKHHRAWIVLGCETLQKISGSAGSPKGCLSTACIGSLLSLWHYLYKKHTLMRRSTVLSLPSQFALHGSVHSVLVCLFNVQILILGHQKCIDLCRFVDIYT
jgi:hypothetical protein